jgi:TonB family protein
MRRSIGAVVGVIVLMLARGVTAQDSIAGIKELYESAAYEDALSAIDRLSSDTPHTPDLPTVELRRYRALCLLALDRVSDAERVVEELIAENPQYRPEPQASPRWVSAVARVHSRLAPPLVQSRYTAAKRHFDQKEFAPAAADFEQALSLLDNPMLEPSVVDSLSDVAMLSRGFLELSRAAMRATATSVPRPASTMGTATAGLGGWIAQFTRYRVYSAVDSGITEPLVVNQDLPPWHTDLRSRFDGEIEVTITETGDVEAVVIRKPVHPLYDKALAEAATRWKYEPARKNGIPVRFRKTLRISLAPS